ncbi:tRNA (guanosine(37)-N1)-methyltransferase TrmD [Patescibacteria group bacterium]|nr:tRNA (guanosine(37)-N1)-methyltransferase TrmD [Patescibacteria group bacterium]
MKFDILTIFPDILDSYINKGMIRIAQEKKLIKIKTHNLRDFAVDARGTVDDRPFGGGPGQVLMVEPVYKALKKLKTKVKKQKTKVVLLSAKGKKWDQSMAKKFSKLDQIIFICPRYEGHDERIKKFVDEEISIGDYVLTGGELGALVIIDSVSRLLPGVLGKQESLKEESHSAAGYLEYPQYTRPEVFEVLRRDKQVKNIHEIHTAETQNLAPDKQNNKRTKTKLKVPQILLSGHHAKIAEWRKKHSKEK